MRKITALLLVAFASLTAMAQGEKPATDWFHKDYVKDGVQGISVEKAYDEVLKGKTSQTVIVAVIDGGVDPEHEDLKSVMWVNKDEIAGNGVDDDNNGYVDDIYGWNFIGGPDGDVGKDNLEITRIYREWSPIYKGKEKKEIKGKAKKNYDEWLALEKEFDKRLAKAQEDIKIVDQYKMFQEMAESTIKDKLGKSDYTKEEVEAIEVEEGDEMTARIKDFILYTMEVDFEAELKGMEDYYGSSLNYMYNVDFDPRDIVGDNYSDVSEKYYGNNNVGALDPAHGTHVAGIIAADRDNGIGMKGIADNVEIMALRVVPDGDERDKDIANAIYYAVDNGADIINMSFGKAYSPRKDVVDAAMKYAKKKNVLLVHAAGNSGQLINSTSNFPNKFYKSKKKGCKTWIEVGAQGWNGMENLPASFSNYGETTVDIFSPGVDIYSTIPGNEYAYFNGTSMAAPALSGVAALLMSYYPDLSAEDVREILMESGTDYSDEMVKKPGADEKVAFRTLSVSGKVINAYEACKLAEEKTK